MCCEIPFEYNVSKKEQDKNRSTNQVAGNKIILLLPNHLSFSKGQCFCSYQTWHSESKKCLNIGALVVWVVIPINHHSLVGGTLADMAVLCSEMGTH